jgi:hypothetical protein
MFFLLKDTIASFVKYPLSTAAWISRYYRTHLQSFELRNVVHYRTGFIT